MPDNAKQILAKVAALVSPDAQRQHAELVKSGRAVVWARYYNGDDGWERLKQAIGELEDRVGRPMTEGEI